MPSAVMLPELAGKEFPQLIQSAWFVIQDKGSGWRACSPPHPNQNQTSAQSLHFFAVVKLEALACAVHGAACALLACVGCAVHSSIDAPAGFVLHTLRFGQVTAL
jgi:hypothetical protein